MLNPLSEPPPAATAVPAPPAVPAAVAVPDKAGEAAVPAAAVVINAVHDAAKKAGLLWPESAWSKPDKIAEGVAVPGAAKVSLMRALNPRLPLTRNPKPETRNPKPETRNPKPETLNPKPETRNPKPPAPNAKSENRNQGVDAAVPAKAGKAPGGKG